MLDLNLYILSFVIGSSNYKNILIVLRVTEVEISSQMQSTDERRKLCVQLQIQSHSSLIDNVGYNEQSGSDINMESHNG